MAYSRKINYAFAVLTAVTAFAEAVERIGELDEIYTDSGYESGGSNAITDEDLGSGGYDITAADLSNFATFATNVALFMNAGDPAVVDYQSHINKFRNMDVK